jgi:hypothetical protein
MTACDRSISRYPGDFMAEALDCLRGPGHRRLGLSGTRPDSK